MKIFLAILLAVLPMAVQAQYYSAVSAADVSASTNGIIEAAIVYADSVGGGDLQSVTAEGATTDIKLTLTNDLMLVSNIVDTAGHKVLAVTDGAQALWYDGGVAACLTLDGAVAPSLNDSAGSAIIDLLDRKILLLAGSATVNEFSIDGTLAGNSDTAVPTEKAVRAYVDGVRTNIQTVLPGVFTITEAMHRWTFVAQTTSNVVYQLPSVDITTKALVYDFVNFQLAVDTVAVRRADTDIFSDSTNGSFFASTVGETGATCRIYLADSNKWVFKALDGTWTPNYLGP